MIGLLLHYSSCSFAAGPMYSTVESTSSLQNKNIPTYEHSIHILLHYGRMCIYKYVDSPKCNYAAICPDDLHNLDLMVIFLNFTLHNIVMNRLH